MVIVLCLVVCIVGLIVFALFHQKRPTLAEIGKIAYGCGLLAFLLRVGEAALSFLNR